MFFPVLNMWHMGIMNLSYIDHYGKYQDSRVNNNKAEESCVSLDKLFPVAVAALGWHGGQEELRDTVQIKHVQV